MRRASRHSAFRRSVVQPLYGVAHRQDEGRLRRGRLPPDAFINTGLRFPGAVAQQHEMKIVRRRGADGQPRRQRDAAEPGQDAAHHASPAGAATKR